ncbi:MAG: DNA repair protein RadC [Chthoniobacteraceae bacterium]|nr:DNA repair protein RadC [Chthoniobacteraceae bacterium]
MPLTIHELPPEDRPREKLALRGADALSDSELIAILLRTGMQGANAIDVARQLLARYGSLGGLARCSVKELAAIKGIGPAKAVQLAAAFGLGARLARETASRVKIDRPEQIYAMLGPEMWALHQESLRVVLLDARDQLLRVEEVSLGSADRSVAHPREIFRPALIYSASSVIVAHNHPSGDPSPSEADYRLTQRLKEAANLLQITLSDHVIIGAPGPSGRPGYVSFRQMGLL